MHEKMPTVRINSAAAAIVMPAICAMVRFSWPFAETPSEPALAVAMIGAVVVGGGKDMIASVVDIVELVTGAEEVVKILNIAKGCVDVGEDASRIRVQIPASGAVLES
jgi:hypothetical protein